MILEFGCHQYGSQECLFFRESEKRSFRRLLVIGSWLLSRYTEGGAVGRGELLRFSSGPTEPQVPVSLLQI